MFTHFGNPNVGFAVQLRLDNPTITLRKPVVNISAVVFLPVIMHSRFESSEVPCDLDL